MIWYLIWIFNYLQSFIMKIMINKKLIKSLIYINIKKKNWDLDLDLDLYNR
jgi:hypothetical protein